MNFVVLCSSRGTTFQATIEAMQEGSLKASCKGLITDSRERGCIEKAEAAGISVLVVEKKEGESREDYDARLHEGIISLGEVDCIAAMGWMFIMTSSLIEKWRNRILNVHPSLLPAYGGKGMYGSRVHEAVLASGEIESGMTIHFISEGVDEGEILVQKKCSVEEDDTVDSLQQKVQDLEKEWYPKALHMIEVGEITLGS